MREPTHNKRGFWLGSVVLILAIAAIALSAGNQAAAQFEDPRRLLELIKKKGGDTAKEEAGKKRQLPNVLRGRTQDGTKTAITPRNVPGNVPGNAPGTVPGKGFIGKNVIGKGTDSKGPANAALSKGIDGKGINPNSTLPKGIDGKNAKTTIGKATDGKGTNPKSVLGKGDGKELPKGLQKSALSKAGDGKGLPKAGLGNGIDGKGLSAQSISRNPMLRGATPVERLRLRADHRREMFTARLRLPFKPLPGERGFTGVPPVAETRFVSTEMVFRAGPNASPQAVEAAARRLGLTAVASENVGLAGGTLYTFRVAPGRPVPDVIRALERENLGVASANYVYRLSQDQDQDQNQSQNQDSESDLSGKTSTRESDQYVVNKLQLGEAHKLATGNNVLVAVIDSAIDPNHPDLAGAIVETFDAVGRREPAHFHGTGMVGAIAAHRKLLGVAPGARILAIQAFSTTSRQSPEATTRQILAGLEWAISKGARVINMSFAGPYDPMLQLAMKNAYAKGVVLIAAAGNLGPKSAPLYPAADPHVIAVTATDAHDNLFAQSVRGPHVAVAAPGVDVMVPAPEQNYQLTTGTSVAAAHVSGVAALLIERHPSVDAATVLEVLTSTARNLNSKGRDDQFGWGLIDPAAAIAELDSRMADGNVATASRSPAPKQAAPKQATPKTAAPRLAPASAQ